MKFLNHAVRFVVCWLVIAIMAALASADEEQPWLIERPEKAAEVVEELPVENFWGYEYSPVVITWYGKHVPKMKHELQPFRAFGAEADGSEALQECEDKVEEVIDLLETDDTQFASIVVCLERYIVKLVEEEEEK